MIQIQSQDIIDRLVISTIWFILT